MKTLRKAAFKTFSVILLPQITWYSIFQADGSANEKERSPDLRAVRERSYR
jgi:hypothetical protein